MKDGGASVRLLTVPYDSEAFQERMGAGPPAIADRAVKYLRDAGHEVAEQQIEPISEWHAEIQTAFELQRVVTVAVRQAVKAGELPIILSGNCNTTVGVLAGAAAPGKRVGLLWLDDHGDFNTPETSESGFLDGQSLSMVVGRCWRAATDAVPGFTPLPERDVLLVGAHLLDRAEEEEIRLSGISWLPPDSVRESGMMATAMTDLAERVDTLHVHIDLDVHDSEDVARANAFAMSGGLRGAEVQRVIRQIGRYLPIGSATMSSFDPSFDEGGRMLQTAVDLLATLAEVARPVVGRIR